MKSAQKFKEKVGQMCRRSFSLAYGFYIGRLRKFNRAREIEFNFLPLGLSSLNLAHLFIMFMATKFASYFLLFCLGT